MAKYVILSHFSPEAFGDPKKFKKLAEDVSSKVKNECPGAKVEGKFCNPGSFRRG